MNPFLNLPPTPEAEPLHGPLSAKVVGFCRLLRGHGFTVGLSETQDALRVACHFLCTDFGAFQDGLRALLCVSDREFAPFAQLFEGYWCAPGPASRIVPAPAIRTLRTRERQGGLQVPTGLAQEFPPGEATSATTGASTLEVLRTLDFSAVTAADQHRLERLAGRLWQRMQVNRPRRLRGAHWKKRLHFRRTMRRNLSKGGEPLHLVHAGKKRRKPRLVVLLDVSGSMEVYSFNFLRLLHALQRRFRRVHSFLFSTTLEDVSGALSARSLEGALTALARRRMGWHGGTRIGACLQTLLALHGERVFRPDTDFIILSDGLDTGEPEPLAAALKAIRRRVHRIVWLNPLLGIEGYQPLARGMRTALPLVDVFAPAHSLESLLDMEKVLVK